MPTYNCKCPKCGHVQEYICSMSEREKGEALPDCENLLPNGERCQTKTEAATTFNENGGFILKGRGWYKSGGY